MKRILIVDDDPLAAAALRPPLVRKGYHVALAADGEEALEHIRIEEPDLVILDVVMPGLSGFEVCRRLRETEGDRRTPVIFVTARGRVSDMVEARAAGSDLYLVKPVVVPRLVNMVEMFLSADRRAGRGPGPSSGAPGGGG